MSKYTLKAGITALKWPKFAIDYFMTRPEHERTLSLEKPNEAGQIDVSNIAAWITDIRQEGDEFVMDIDTKDTQSGHVLNNILSTGKELYYYLYGVASDFNIEQCTNIQNANHIEVREDGNPIITGAFVKDV
ncbi:MAG: hypothetical protein IJH65_08520 [Methanobrevibacter sp.]|nr:hypothetical protein [Methanobrevibacter sp.]